VQTIHQVDTANKLKDYNPPQPDEGGAREYDGADGRDCLLIHEPLHAFHVHAVKISVRAVARSSFSANGGWLPVNAGHKTWLVQLTRISHLLSTAAANPGMPTALRSVACLDVLSSTLRNPVRKAG
jgi:hypothetical protein